MVSCRLASLNAVVVPFAREYRKFPVFSQLAGNWGLETGSLETSSSSGEFANFRSLSLGCWQRGFRTPALYRVDRSLRAGIRNPSRLRPFVWTGEDIVMGARVFADAAAAVFKAGRTCYFLFSMFHKNAIGASTTPIFGKTSTTDLSPTCSPPSLIPRSRSYTIPASDRCVRLRRTTNERRRRPRASFDQR